MKMKRNSTSVGGQIGDDFDIKSIKLSLKSILEPDHAKTIKDILLDRNVVMTKIASLASLLLLFKVNTAVDGHSFDFFLKMVKKRFLTASTPLSVRRQAVLITSSSNSKTSNGQVKRARDTFFCILASNKGQM